MRKGYGPTGVSFPYPFKTFQNDLAIAAEAGTPLLVELVVAGNTYSTEVEPNMSDAEAQTLYDKIDHVALRSDGPAIYQLFTN